MPEVKCPKCGSTKLEVISYDEVAQTYYADVGEWGDSDLHDNSYIVEAICSKCGEHLPPEILGYPTLKDLMRGLVEVMVAMPWPDESGVLVNGEVVYTRPNDARWGMSPVTVAGLLCQALGFHEYKVATFDQIVSIAGAAPIQDWDEAKRVIAAMPNETFEVREVDAA